MRRALLLGRCALLAVPAPAGAATVDLMVVGKERVLREAAPVTLKARSVRVGGRRCAVGRATPLSVLAGTRLALRLQRLRVLRALAARRGRAVRARRSGRTAARGPAGWVYKVGRRAGTTGAADPSGPFGRGQAAGAARGCSGSGASRTRGEACQRTLEVVVGAHGGRPGAALRSRCAATTTAGAACRWRARRCGSARRRRPRTRAASRRWRRPRAGARRLTAERDGDGALVAADGARAMRRLLAAPRRCCAALARLRPRRRRRRRPAAPSSPSRATSAPRSSGTTRRKTIPGGETVMRQLQRKFDGRDALRRRLRAGDRRRRAAGGAAAGRSTGSTTSTGSRPDTARPRASSSPATASGGTTTTGAAAMRVPAVVGSFPEPFLSGAAGQADPGAGRLRGGRAARVPRGARAARGGGREGRRLRARSARAPGRACCALLVGTWSEVRVDPTARRIEKGPKVSGVFARPARDGRARSSCSTRAASRCGRWARARGWWRRRASSISSRRGS